ncbi:MAG: AMP-binding protein [Anaerotruncus sp.]|nr:AMP-binding protein [Anaerotruncus sp.]
MFLEIDRRPPDYPAVLTDDRCITYAQLCADAAIFTDRVPANSLVFCFCENSYGALCGYLGLMSAGAVPLLLSANIQEELQSNLLKIYQPQFLWLPERCNAFYPNFTPLFSCEGYTLLHTTASAISLHPELALLLTTSGSTGSPKLVRQSLRNIHANADAIIEYLEITPDERAITTLPMHYTYGLSILHSHLAAGATILLTNHTILESEFWQQLCTQQATSFGGVPYTYEILERVGFFEMNLPTLRYFTQAGGKLSKRLHEKCAQYAAAHSKRFYVMYGQTEATARMGYLPWQLAEKKCGCMGLAVPNGRFALMDADHTEIAKTDAVGELVYYGENVAMGYAETQADLGKGDEWKGILYTGDLATCDADGIYTIVGRKKRFIKLYGNRISLDGCERLLGEQFPGIDCACVGTDDQLDIYLTDAQLCEQVSPRLAELLGVRQRAIQAHYLAQIPRNSAGKICYQQLEGER